VIKEGLKKKNIEHRTLNVEHRTLNEKEKTDLTQRREDAGRKEIKAQELKD
jgi:hypothetical protein